MKKSLIVLLLSLVLITGLCGVFSVNESPSGHVYNPMYNQCEAYTSVPVPTHIIVDNTLFDPVINGTIIGNTGSINITVRDIAIFQYFIVKLNGTVILDYQINGYDVMITRNLSAGKYTISVLYSIMDPQYSGYTQACSIGFEVIGSDHYYQNQYANIFPITNNLSQHNAVRPALFVEGFNIFSSEGSSGFTYRLANKWKNELSDSKIYVLSLNNSMDDLRNNAMIVLGALRFVHNIQPTNQFIEGTSLFGYSMGGILARYALAFAEHWDIPHFTTQFISIDAPHRGASINENAQNLLDMVYTDLQDVGREDARLTAAIESLQSPAGKQLIRKNIYASNQSHPFASNDFREFFSEIDLGILQGYSPNGILINSNPLPDQTTRYRAGMPYKQNNIKCIAYSNGSLFRSGAPESIGNLAEYDFDIDLPPSHNDGNADWMEYDYQPGSVIDSLNIHEGGTGYQFDFYLNYSPVIVPTRSSLYLVPESVGGQGDPDQQFSFGVYEDIVNNGSTSIDEHLLNHSYFDKLFYPGQPQNTQWNWRHGELNKSWVATQVTSTANWLDLIENRTVCTVSGHVDDVNISSVTGKMYVNNQFIQNIPLSSTGDYSV
jgi:hypothetical protein